MASDARPGRSRHFRGGLIEDDHVYAALMRERDEALALAAKMKQGVESWRASYEAAQGALDEAWAERAKVVCERDEARADLHAERLWAVQRVRERNVAQSQAARYREALDALRELADAAARRIALRQAVAMPERVTAGEAFQAEGIPPGDMLGDREWLRWYRAARALRGGGGA